MKDKDLGGENNLCESQERTERCLDWDEACKVLQRGQSPTEAGSEGKEW